MAGPGTFDSLIEAIQKTTYPIGYSPLNGDGSRLSLPNYKIYQYQMSSDSDDDTLVILPYDKETPDAKGMTLKKS